ncbi:MAG: PRC-barrel domain-containing protein [Methyloceanibacter sp.]|jgi:sporulation protein YlmC with PRC-barrel domain|nr:PRC-barrel domain-containing protein [Methyloceanibacter sp.]
MKMFASATAIALLLTSAAITTPAVAAQESGQLMTSVPGDALPVSEYYKEDVYDAHDSKIGDIRDVLLEKSGQVVAVILGVGGFLGIGEKDVAVPFNAIRVTEKDGKRYLVMDTTKEALQSARGYTYDRNKGAWVPATK